MRTNRNITHGLAEFGVGRTPDFVGHRVEVGDCQADDKPLDLELSEHAFVPHAATRTVRLANVTRVK